MNLVNIKARTLPEAFFKCCRLAFQHGYLYTIDKGSFEGTTRLEFDSINITITHPGIRPLAPDIPVGVPAPTNDDEIEKYFAEELMNPEVGANRTYTYGEDIVPQCQKIIDRYKQDGPECNQLCMSIGGPHSIDLEHSQCLRIVDTRIRYGALHFFIYFRSWDLWAGFPVNLGGLQLLKEYMAHEIGVEDGQIFAWCKGLHLYNYTLEYGHATAGLINPLEYYLNRAAITQNFVSDMSKVNYVHSI